MKPLVVFFVMFLLLLPLAVYADVEGQHQQVLPSASVEAEADVQQGEADEERKLVFGFLFVLAIIVLLLASAGSEQ